jgi:hypothetical protein
MTSLNDEILYKRIINADFLYVYWPKIATCADDENRTA